jgi:segregation and condensation protein A
MESEYKISLEVFEGPLDLLLYLIKKEEVDIYDISIEHITNQYLKYLEALEIVNIRPLAELADASEVQEVSGAQTRSAPKVLEDASTGATQQFAAAVELGKKSIEVAGDFVVMAANLLYIKSRTLLPKDQQMPEEDVEEEDPRWELIRQLIEYKKFKEASLHLHNQEALQGMLFPRPGIVAGTDLPEAEPFLLNEVSIFDLINAFQKALRRLPKEENISEIYEETYTVADRMQHLLRMIQPGVVIPFQELFSSVASRSEMVVTFLAMLELIRMKQLTVRQEEEFGEIVIST